MMTKSEGAASHAEQFHIFATENIDELSARYGSVQAAGGSSLVTAIRGRSGSAVRPRSAVGDRRGVPDDLKPLDQPQGVKGYEQVLSPDVIERRREWLRGSGKASSDELARYERDRHVPGSEVLRRVT